MKILIAYDGSTCADDALTDLPRAGLPQQAEALIISVAEVFLPPQTERPAQVPPAVRHAWAAARQAVEQARTVALQAQTRVQALFPAWTVQVEACADSPSWGVIKRADIWQPDLLVVGSHGRSVLGRLMLGSVSYNIVTQARCSVRVGRRPLRASDGPVHLVIGVDGSPDARAAVRAMAARTWPDGSTVNLVAILDARLSTALAPSPPLLEEWMGAHDGEAQTWVYTMLDTFKAPLQAAGLTVTTVVQEGDPKWLLPALAERQQADCLVVGARGLSRVDRFLLGSVSAAAAARAHCSVEVIRPPYTS